MGLYAYDRVFLDYFLGSQESELEKIEKLEQLRALQNGFKIAVEIVKESSIGIDMPNDLEKIRFE
jgi:3-deoxy-manno-octulosonate cytidylyltransferase (CMP-KDO synthetase)